MLETVLFTIAEWIYWFVSKFDLIIHEINFTPLSSVSGFASLFLGALLVNLVVVGLAVVIARLRNQ